MDAQQTVPRCQNFCASFATAVTPSGRPARRLDTGSPVQGYCRNSRREFMREHILAGPSRRRREMYLVYGIVHEISAEQRYLSTDGCVVLLHEQGHVYSLYYYTVVTIDSPISLKQEYYRIFILPWRCMLCSHLSPPKYSPSFFFPLA